MRKCQHVKWERVFTKVALPHHRPRGSYVVTVCCQCDEQKREVGIGHKTRGHKRFVKTSELQTNTQKFGRQPRCQK